MNSILSKGFLTQIRVWFRKNRNYTPTTKPLLKMKVYDRAGYMFVVRVELEAVLPDQVILNEVEYA